MGVIRCDQEEAVAIQEILGDPVVCAAKSYMGNLGAGSGIVEIIASLLAIQNQQMFHTINCETPDPKCPVRVSEKSDSPGRSVLNLNITPQGQASAVLIQSVEV